MPTRKYDSEPVTKSPGVIKADLFDQFKKELPEAQDGYISQMVDQAIQVARANGTAADGE